MRKTLEKLAWIKYAVYLVLEFEETLSKRRKSDHEISRINPVIITLPAISAIQIGFHCDLKVQQSNPFNLEP